MAAFTSAWAASTAAWSATNWAAVGTPPEVPLPWPAPAPLPPALLEADEAAARVPDDADDADDADDCWADADADDGAEAWAFWASATRCWSRKAACSATRQAAVGEAPATVVDVVVDLGLADAGVAELTTAWLAVGSQTAMAFCTEALAWARAAAAGEEVWGPAAERGAVVALVIGVAAVVVAGVAAAASACANVSCAPARAAFLVATVACSPVASKVAST
jgi:hypothetical protein